MAGFDSQKEQEMVFYSTTSILAPGLPQPNVKWLAGDLPLGEKRPGSETDMSI
jgi:hypothetical protein